MTDARPTYRQYYRSRYAEAENFAARERVALGVALLNERVDGWLNQLDMDRFDLTRSEDCIIGQLHPSGNFDAAVPGWLGLSFGYAAEAGFYAGPVPLFRDEPSPEYQALNAEWRRVVAELRAAA